MISPDANSNNKHANRCQHKLRHISGSFHSEKVDSNMSVKVLSHPSAASSGD